MKSWLLALVGVVFVAPAFAAETASLYTAEVPFDQQAKDARAQAYDAALKQVLTRVSGPGLAGDPALYESLFPDPSRYVVQFQPGPDDTLLVTFDGAAIEQALRAANQTVWGSDRPLTLVWLAVDWGQGEREIIGSVDADEAPDDARSLNRNRQLRERILESASQRGLPVAFPLLDSEDLAQVEFSDVWGGFDDRVVAASARYNVNSILIGRVRANGAEQNRWTYLFGDEQRQWTGAPETVMAGVSDMLATEFAISGSEPVRAVDLNVHGVTSVDAYGDVQAMLANVNVIESFAITEVAGDRVSYRVAAHGGAVRLARALRFVGLVEQDRIDTSGFGIDDDNIDSLEFFYNP
jgi:hypothetical protein